MHCTGVSFQLRARKKRASVFLISLLLVIVTSVSVVAWLGFVTDSQRQAHRDRARVHATMAAEAGIEMVIDWFNNHGKFNGHPTLSGLAVADNYPGVDPNPHDNTWLTSTVPAPTGTVSVNALWVGNTTSYYYQTYKYGFFEPYVKRVKSSGQFVATQANQPPKWQEQLTLDAQNRPIPLDVTWFKKVGNTYVSKIPTCELTPPNNRDYWVKFTDANGGERATLTRIVLVNTQDFATLGEPASVYATDRVICKVIAEATAPALESETGEKVIRVECLLRENPLFNLYSPSAIISGVSVDFRGQYKVRWGEVWAKTSVALPSGFPGAAHTIPSPVSPTGRKTTGNEDKVGNTIVDKWFRLRTQEYIVGSNESIDFSSDPTTRAAQVASRKFASGEPNLNVTADGTNLAGGTTYKGLRTGALPSTSQYNYYTVYEKYVDPGLTGSIKNAAKREYEKYYEDYQNLLQHQNLIIPSYDYQTIKDVVISNGYRYFYTDVDGQLIGTNESGELEKRSYQDWLDMDPSDADYWNTDDMLIFIDSVPVQITTDPNTGAQVKTTVNDPVYGFPVITPNQYPRKIGEGTDVTIQVSGQGTHTRGMIFVNAHLDYTGQGNPPYHYNITKNGSPYVVNPEGNGPSEDIKISHNGILYSWGQIQNAANRVVYGSVFAEGGFDSAGGPSVYYNYRLKDGAWLDLHNGYVFRGAWKIRKTAIPNI